MLNQPMRKNKIVPLTMSVLPNGVTGIDWENCSCDCRGCRGGKKVERGSDFFWFNHSTHWGSLHPNIEVLRVFRSDIWHRSINVGWCNRIDSDTTISPLTCQRTSQMMHSGLGGIIIHLLLRLVGNEARHGTNCDDRTLLTLHHKLSKCTIRPKDFI